MGNFKWRDVHQRHGRETWKRFDSMPDRLEQSISAVSLIAAVSLNAACDPATLAQRLSHTGSFGRRSCLGRLDVVGTHRQPVLGNRMRIGARVDSFGKL